MKANINIKQCALYIFALLFAIFFFNHPFYGMIILIPSLGILAFIIVYFQHKENIKDIGEYIKTKYTCEYCGCQLEKSSSNCPNCGAIIKIDNSDILSALENENIEYTKNIKQVSNINKFAIFIIILPFLLIFLFIIFCLVMALLNGGSYTF